MAASIRAVIIEDVAFNRDELRYLLEDHFPEINIVAEAENGVKGLQAILDHNPNLVFLDVEMPVMNGLQMLKLIENPTFEVVFTTAFDKYAINAIRLSALDYLLKPLQLTELQATIRRFQQKHPDELATAPRIQNFVENMERVPSEPSRLAIASTDGMTFLNIEDIIWCEAESNYTIFHLKSRKQVVASRTLKEYEETLSEFGFIRIHKSNLINAQRVSRLENDRVVVMEDGSVVEISKRKFPEIRKLLRA